MCSQTGELKPHSLPGPPCLLLSQGMWLDPAYLADSLGDGGTGHPQPLMSRCPRASHGVSLITGRHMVSDSSVNRMDAGARASPVWCLLSSCSQWKGPGTFQLGWEPPSGQALVPQCLILGPSMEKLTMPAWPHSATKGVMNPDQRDVKWIRCSEGAQGGKSQTRVPRKPPMK